MHNEAVCEESVKDEKKKKPAYSGTDLGKDPTKCPGEGFELKGRGPPGSWEGNWVKGKGDTQESLHPDLDHAPPIGPHWDYSGPGFKDDIRLYPDGTWKQKMDKLYKHELSLEIAIPYFQYSLDGTNKLSSMLMKLINFKSRVFYTLLQDTADLQKTNEFKYGGMACGVRSHLKSLILSKLHLDNKLSCIFDDTKSTCAPRYEEPVFSACGLSYEQ